MRYLAWALAGVLLAAAVHLALMSPAERARILQVAPAREVAAEPESTDSDQPAPVPLPALPARGPAVTPSGLVVPVQGVQPAQLSPTFEDARGGGRTHEALDIMAPAGTPVLAVTDGHVEKLFDSAQGGLTIYQFDPGGHVAYYYAHLERYAPGLAEQQPVRQGQVIGYVGSSGNASADAPHLHFAVFVLGPDKRWWEGAPIDPYPLFTAPAADRYP